MLIEMDVLRIHPRVMRDLRRKGLAEEAIARMTPEQAFNEFCQFNGFAGDWGHTLASILDSLRASQTVVNAEEILTNPGVHDWTKRVLKSAQRRDLVDAVHDLELVLAALKADLEDVRRVHNCRLNQA